MWLLVTLINTMVVIRFESTETSHRLLGFPSPAFTDWTSTGLPFRYQCFLPIDVSIELAHNIRSSMGAAYCSSKTGGSLMHGQWPSHYYSIGMCSHCWLTGYTQAIVTHYSQQIFIITILNGPLLGFPVSESNDIKGANSPGLFLFSSFLSRTHFYSFLLLLFAADFYSFHQTNISLYTLAFFFFSINILFFFKALFLLGFWTETRKNDTLPAGCGLLWCWPWCQHPGR